MESEILNLKRKEAPAGRYPISGIRHSRTRPGGFASLLIVLVVVVVALAIGVGFNTLGLGELQLGFFESQSGAAFDAADGCVEEALIRLKRNSSFTTSTLSVGDTACTVLVTGGGSSRTIYASSTNGSFTREIRVSATLTGSKVAATEWREVGE